MGVEWIRGQVRICFLAFTYIIHRLVMRLGIRPRTEVDLYRRYSGPPVYSTGI
jgi:hypothetical protein